MVELDIILQRNAFKLRIQETFGAGITGIYGPSGAGKSSILQTIAGFEKGIKGSIRIADTAIFDSKTGINLAVEKRRIAYVFQDGRLFPHMNVTANLKFGYKKNSNPILSFAELVDLLRIEHLLQRKPSQLSGGEQQRVALGRALLSNPQLLLLDEPFSAVDKLLRNEILPYLLRLQKATDLPMLVVSHDLNELLHLTNTLCLVKQGKCVGHGQFHDLLLHKNTSEMLGGNSLTNAIETKVAMHPKHKQAMLCWQHNKHCVWIRCDWQPNQKQTGQIVKFFVQANDIALAKHEIHDISTQNQLQGKVQHIVQHGTALLCVVDVGFPLLAEITNNSRKRLAIEEGSTVWCLFKAVAVEAMFG